MPGAAALVARGEDVEIASAGELEPDSIVRHRVDDEADHGCRGHAPRGRRARFARRSDRALAARAGVAAGRAHAREPDRRRRAGCTRDHGRGSPHLPRRLGLPVRLLAAGGGRALREAPGVRAARDAGRVARDARAGADAPPARRGVALQHLLRHPGRPGRARLGAAAAGLPRRAHLRAARDGRHRPSMFRRRSSTGCRHTAERRSRRSTTGSGRSRRSSRRGAGGLVSTLADWHRFGRMLLAEGGGLLSPTRCA